MPWTWKAATITTIRLVKTQGIVKRPKGEPCIGNEIDLQQAGNHNGVEEGWRYESGHPEGLLRQSKHP